jgi:hypothetical protein
VQKSGCELRLNICRMRHDSTHHRHHVCTLACNRPALFSMPPTLLTAHLFPFSSSRTIPLFLLLTVLLLYSVAWFSYLTLAQADPPSSAKSGTITLFLPFLPYSPLRCLKVNWAAAQYAMSAIKVVLPAVLDWSYRRVMVLGTQGGGIVK